MSTLFLDTGYVIALEAADDENHETAVRHWRSLTPSLPRLVTTSYVVAEVVTFFNSKASPRQGVGIQSALAFDGHFKQAGFQKLP
jgi:predicted nucleic acid-binding protein